MTFDAVGVFGLTFDFLLKNCFSILCGFLTGTPLTKSSHIRLLTEMKVSKYKAIICFFLGFLYLFLAVIV